MTKILLSFSRLACRQAGRRESRFPIKSGMTTILFIFTFLAFGVLPVRADDALSVRLQQPASQTNNTSLTLTFTALDTANNPITVTCYKKGPSDSSFSQFGSPITLSNGGNTSQCQAGSIINQDGVYSFYVTATDGSATTTSNTVSTTISTATPGTPTGYTKQQLDSCTFKISFHTANDGRTVRVDLYSSQNPSFTVDSSSKVNSLGIGPNQDGSITNGIGDCTKTYYFAIRAFDAYGNGSGVAGDTNNVTINNTVNPTVTQGAIPVSGSQNGSQNGVLGAETTPGLTGTPAAKQVLGSQTTPEKANQNSFASHFSSKKLWAAILVVVIALFLAWFYFLRKNKKGRRE